MSRLAVALAICLITVAAASAGEKSGSVSASIERALPFLEDEGTWWIEKKKCVSCHHTTFLVWAKDLALQSGFEVNESTLDEQRKWVWEFFLSPIPPDPKKPNAKPDPDALRGDRNIEGISQLLVSTSAGSVPETVQESLRKMIVSNQAKDGDWKSGGQLPRQARPKAETQWISNQWATLALRDNPMPKTTSNTGSDDAAAKTNEWFAINAALNRDSESLKKLLQRQNEDGGWSWMDGEPSSPTGTGQALFALGRTGAAKDHPEAIKRARGFLIQTQSEDGHWETRSTKDREESVRTSDFWGTAWAVIGLLESQRSMSDPPQSQQDSR
jgi:squalene-hopene/tetraprenyl-beta-curcumene cyclase